MKTLAKLAMSLLALSSLTLSQASAQGHSHFIKIPETVEGIWKEIGNQQTKLDAVVAAKNLGEAHDHGFAIRDLVRALPAKVAAERKSKAEEAVPEINKLASAIDKSAAGGAQKTTEENVKKLATAVTTLQTALKAK
ncbi:MAG: hypothetical protein EAZ42_08520 [Verrucomicrobia bacterium]|nr:MAG: hypothetical protein EAZ42_08520 [Verrucomicrobiota bacterium]